MTKYGIDSITNYETGKFMAVVKTEDGVELWRSTAFLDTHNQAIWLAVRWLENHIGKDMPPHLQQKISDLLELSLG